MIDSKRRSTYEGQLNERGERHGYGIYRVIFAGKYEGYWRNGFKDGQGKHPKPVHFLIIQALVSIKTAVYSILVNGKEENLMDMG